MNDRVRQRSADDAKKVRDLLESLVADHISGAPDREVLRKIEDYGILSLPILKDFLSQDRDFDAVESMEKVLKTILRKELSGKVSGDLARRLAVFHKDVGLILKYKSYSVKACTPLGYSIFPQNPGEGFSFQRHISHKTEAFHIVKTHPRAYVFFCTYSDWVQNYDQEAFALWLEGNCDPRYDRFRFIPRPGDIFILDRQDIVHSAIGCMVEEFADTSSDKVDRLHDQNLGRSIPSHFCRNYAVQQLLSFDYPKSNRLIDIHSHKSLEVFPRRIREALVVPIAENGIKAAHYTIEAKGSAGIQVDEERHTSIYVTKGSGKVVVGEIHEVKCSSPPAIEVATGNVLFIPAGIYYEYVADESDSLELSEHKVSATSALT
jgi:mannose-6-phosphate isomerase-like protein (cupin superfamily)